MTLFLQEQESADINECHISKPQSNNSMLQSTRENTHTFNLSLKLCVIILLCEPFLSISRISHDGRNMCTKLKLRYYCVKVCLRTLVYPEDIRVVSQPFPTFLNKLLLLSNTQRSFSIFSWFQSYNSSVFSSSEVFMSSCAFSHLSKGVPFTRRH